MTHLDLVRPSLFKSQEKFEALQEKLDKRNEYAAKRKRLLPPHEFDPIYGMGYAEYRQWCSDQFLALIDRLLTAPPHDPNRGLLGKPLNGGSGIMLRFGNSKEELIGFIDLINGGLLRRGIHPIPFYGEHLKRKKSEYATVKAKINHHKEIAGANAKYLIGVVHAARRSDRFPADTTVFIDFTERYTTMQAMEQGTAGRATGFKWSNDRRAIVLMSTYNAKLVQVFRGLYRQYGVKMPVIRPAIGAIAVQGVRLSTIRVLTLDFDQLRTDPTIGTVISRIETQIDQMFSRHIIIEAKMLKTNTGKERRKQLRLADGPPETTEDYRRVLRNSKKATRLWTNSIWYWPLFQRILTEEVRQAIESWLRDNSVGDPVIMWTDGNTRGERLACDENLWAQVAVGNFHRGTSAYRHTTQHVDTSLRRNHAPNLRMSRDAKGAERVPNILFEEITPTPGGAKVRPKSISLVLVNEIHPFALLDKASNSNDKLLRAYAGSLMPRTLPDQSNMFYKHMSAEEQAEVGRIKKQR